MPYFDVFDAAINVLLAIMLVVYNKVTRLFCRRNEKPCISKKLSCESDLYTFAYGEFVSDSGSGLREKFLQIHGF